MVLMRRKLNFIMVLAVLATCLVCPLMQLFDRWDHEIQTGQDTESAFVVLALSIGATFVLARAFVHISRALPVARRISARCSLFRTSQEVLSAVSTTAFLTASPPAAILRI